MGRFEEDRTASRFKRGVKMRRVAKVFAAIFFVIWLGISLLLGFYYWLTLCSWLGGGLGTVVTIFAAPGLFIFPVIYWIVERQFPVFYFELAAACLVTAGICGALWSVGE